jgi:putative PIN family toxin of toxin-antitoxin system
MPRVCPGTNVLVSAFIAQGPPSRILQEAIVGHIRLVLAVPVLDELQRILTIKLAFDIERWRQTRDLLDDTASETIPAPIGSVRAVSGDPDDDVILACAAAARVDVIVSGDHRHLLPLGEHAGIPILTPQALLARLRA